MITKRIFENGKEDYRVTIFTDKDGSGKRMRKDFYGESKEDAELKMKEYLDKIGKE
ncbi:hypothetical protein [Clostridium sp. YIM B02551]|uniref:hypothetical protein n=1 Tax=Clostridium sp. YIM B02551 TaxID=2910679 RepID=UPI001EECAD7F|nr:hypothetical protein [Clostridium sp. YIM B02551]